MIYLIGIQTLKDLFGFDENIEDVYILPNIIKCQDFIIEPLLGKDKYNEIIDQIEADSVTVANDLFIKKYIHPIIAYYVKSEAIYSVAYKLKNAETEVNAERFNELVRLSKKYLNDSETYQMILKKYVCENSVSILPEKNTFKTGIYLGNGRSINYDERP